LKTALALLLLAAASVAPSLANSFYEGTDTACFYEISSCTPSSSTSSIGFPSAVLFYTPDSSPFGAGSGGGSVELGTFSVGTTDGIDFLGTFDLQVSFTNPGDGVHDYSALTGALIYGDGDGGAIIQFDDPTTQVYNTSGGSFDVSLPSSTIDIGAGGSYNLYATITPLTATPEPASIATVGAGLMLLGIAVYRGRAVKPASVKV
jgi:hypothetical protein